MIPLHRNGPDLPSNCEIFLPCTIECHSPGREPFTKLSLLTGITCAALFRVCAFSESFLHPTPLQLCASLLHKNIFLFHDTVWKSLYLTNQAQNPWLLEQVARLHMEAYVPQSRINKRTAFFSLSFQVAGMVSKAFEHPFDLTKVRLQSQVLDATARFAGPVDCLRQTWQKEGFRGLYRVCSFLHDQPFKKLRFPHF